jgi:hypothetical protein
MSANAQSDSIAVSKTKVKYFNNILAGGLFGESGNGAGLSISTTHGIRIHRVAIGAGLGFDSYLDWKTVPVFGSISFDFAKIRQNAFFVQFNAGYAEARRIDRPEWLVEYKEYGGEMLSPMLGYRISTEKFNLYISGGYKYQKAHFSYNAVPWSSFVPAAENSVEENMNRVVVQIGFGLH